MQTKTIESKYSNSFYTNKVNVGKFSIVKEKAECIREFKNELSGRIFSNLMLYKDMPKNDMIKHFNCYYEGLVGQDIQNAITDVYTSYSNKFEQIRGKTTVNIMEIKPEFYKKNGKKLNNGSFTFKKGDFKEFKIKKHTTRLTKVISYLSKYGSETTLEYVSQLIISLESQINKEVEEDKKLMDQFAFYKDVIFYCNKFSFERLLSVALFRRNNVIDHYNKKPIEFNSLSFRTTSRLQQDIIGYNKNYNSVIKAFVTIGGFAKEEQKKDSTRTETFKISFPAKYSKKHHGKFADYLKEDNSYIMCIERDRLRVILAKDGTREIPIGGEEYIGVDTNIKHNMFAMKDGDTIDYDRDILDGYVNFLQHLDRIQAKKAKMGLSKKEISMLSTKHQKQKDAWHEKFLCDIKMKCRMLVNKSVQEGKNHIVMEDLKLITKSFTESEEYNSMKYSRLWRLLRLSSLKTIVRSIAYKQGICVSFIHPHYTSQRCTCGYISRDNRKTQEEFICQACNQKENADSHSAYNIELRLSEDVLRDKLLKKNDMGEYEPKLLSKDIIKAILISHSYELPKAIMKRDVSVCPNFS